MISYHYLWVLIFTFKIGKFSTINADGQVVVRKDLPKETFYQEISYKWKEWHGPDQIEREELNQLQESVISVNVWMHQMLE